MKLIKPQKLMQGDKVATVSLSWVGAGELPHRYRKGKKQLEETFGLTVVDTKNSNCSVWSRFVKCLVVKCQTNQALHLSTHFY